MYDLDPLGLVIGQLLSSRVVSRDPVFEFSAENGIKYFPLCTCLYHGLFATSKSSGLCLMSA